MKKILIPHKLKIASKIACQMYHYFFQGIKQGQFLYRLKKLVQSLSQATCVMELEQLERPNPNSNAVLKLQKTISGLHQLLPYHSIFSYSILIPVYKPSASFLKTAVESALNQTAPVMEVLLGLDGPQPPEVDELIEKLLKRYPDKLKSHRLDRNKEGGSISATTNAIAKLAKGNFLLLLDHDDWIRPDLLYRYEQTLRLLSNPENSVLFCNEYKIDEKDRVVPKGEVSKPDRPIFPYVFTNFICHCLLIPKTLWNQIGGLRIECNGSQDYDLALRLDAAKAEFYNVPIYLYAWRMHLSSTAKSITQKSYAIDAGLRAFSDYAQAKNLDWKLEHGIFPGSYRAIPALKETPRMQVVIPFKNQKQLTLNAARCILKQKNVITQITAVDNGSTDESIANELLEMGAEVLSSSEPFNFSRLNNFAVTNTKAANDCDLILFHNNDVELDEEALEEMCRWIYQPKIGMVGCRLNYPNGLLQHAGIELCQNGPTHRMLWVNIGQEKPADLVWHSQFIRIVDAVTAACSLIKRRTFLDVGGFDEKWYPIAYSDTNLAMKIRSKGLHCLYTPYAIGTHHESASRTLNNIEDYESSRWLHEQLQGS